MALSPSCPTLGVPTLRRPPPIRRPTLRARIADGLVRLGGRIHAALADLSMWVDPRLKLPGVGPVRPWAGLLVILLLVAGIALMSGGAVWAIREVLPSREVTP